MGPGVAAETRVPTLAPRAAPVAMPAALPTPVVSPLALPLNAPPTMAPMTSPPLIFGFCRFGLAGALDFELIGVERVGLAAEVEVGEFEDQLRGAGEGAGLRRLDYGAVYACAARDDEDVIDDHIFAESEQQRGSFFGLAGAHGPIGADTDEGIFEDGDGAVVRIAR
jgi:hypothetical protein